MTFKSASLNREPRHRFSSGRHRRKTSLAKQSPAFFPAPPRRQTLLFATRRLGSNSDRESYDLSSTRATARFLPGAKKRQVAVLGQPTALPSSIEFPMSLLRVSPRLLGYETAVALLSRCCSPQRKSADPARKSSSQSAPFRSGTKANDSRASFRHARAMPSFVSVLLSEGQLVSPI